MKKKYKCLAKNVGLFSIGSFGSKIITFLLLPLYTSILSTSDYGIVDLISSTAQLLIPILLLSIQDATLRFSMDDNYKKEDVITTTFDIIVKGTCILLFIILLLYILNIFKISVFYWIFLFFVFLFSSLNNCFNLYLKSKNEAKIIAVSGIICTLLTCVLNVIFLIYFKLGILGYMISIILGLFGQILYQLIRGKIYCDIKIKKYKPLHMEMIKYSAPLIANSVSWWINNASDRYILTWISGVAANGIYAVAYKIPTILTTIQGIFYNAWSISAISEFDSKDKDGFIGNNYTMYSFVSIFICSIIILFNLQITSILYANDYFNAWVCVPYLLVSTVFNGISQLEGSLYAATKKTKEVSLTTVIGAIVNTGCNFIFIYYWGPLGAAIATMIGYFTTWLIRTLLLKKFIDIKVNWYKHIGALVLLFIQATIATFNKFYFIQIIILFFILVLYFREFKAIVKKYIFKKNKKFEI